MDPTKPFRELVDRKLWPVAVLLLVALAAIPLLLSRSPEPVATTPIAATSAGDTEPVVDAASAAKRDANRKVLGAEKDPFRAAQVKKAAGDAKAGKGDKAGGSSDKADGGSSSSGSGSSSSGSGSSGGSSADTPTATATPAPTAAPTATPAPVYPLQALEVRFGTTEDPNHAERMLTRLSGLPKGTTPALLYLGLLKDKETAVFLVQNGVDVLGDGSCHPSPADCETLRMRKGDIEFVTVPGGGQYQVEVLKVHTRRTTSAAAARKSRTHTYPGGKRWYREMDGADAGLHYDPGTGTLSKK